MSKFEKPVVGQEITVVESGNRLRYRQDRQPKIFDGTVTKVGRKYFHVEVDTGYKSTREFCLETWVEKTNYTADYIAYPDRQEYMDTRERERLETLIRRTFDGYAPKPFTLQQYQKVVEVLELQKN